jgi:glycerol-3-phosphate dehydrogenase (NAD+)
MQKFGLMFFPDCRKSTFTEESCGIADVITSCAGGRNRRCAEQFVRTGKVSSHRRLTNFKPMDQLEKELLNGQKLQGAATAQEVNVFLKAKGKVQCFPLFTAVYEIVYEGRDPATLVQHGSE